MNKRGSLKQFQLLFLRLPIADLFLHERRSRVRTQKLVSSSLSFRFCKSETSTDVLEIQDIVQASKKRHYLEVLSIYFTAVQYQSNLGIFHQNLSSASLANEFECQNIFDSARTWDVCKCNKYDSYEERDLHLGHRGNGGNCVQLQFRFVSFFPFKYTSL